VREIHGKVSIPFHSEYKVRLKNKSGNLRAKARVWIDGRKVSNLGDFILHPGETLDLERFLDCDMDTGNRFKFVPLSDSRVNDPTDSGNGTIKVEFYREQEFVINWEGSVSNQRFVGGADFATDITPTTLTLRLSNTKTSAVQGPRPGTIRAKYCPGCGKRRRRRTDKFCSRCGGKY
jgi:hypothetical protein